MDASVGLLGSLCPPRGIPTCACHHDGEGPGAGPSLKIAGELQPLTWEPKGRESDGIPAGAVRGHQTQAGRGPRDGWQSPGSRQSSLARRPPRGRLLDHGIPSREVNGAPPGLNSVCRSGHVPGRASKHPLNPDSRDPRSPPRSTLRLEPVRGPRPLAWREDPGALLVPFSLPSPKGPAVFTRVTVPPGR